jgi:hypothetical protein
MLPHSRSSWKIWTLTGAGSGSLVALSFVAACSIGAGETSEIDSYDSAVRTQRDCGVHS